MTYAIATINPFYAARQQRAATLRRDERQPIIFAKLPPVPRNASPVPHLTSLYHNPDAGPYGDRRYPGNCSGNLIKDLLLYYQPKRVLDPMTGGGTCKDVCRELGVFCISGDLRQGLDACDPDAWPFTDLFDFVWLHPPYWRQKLYTDDPRDLSRCPTLDAFYNRLTALILNCDRMLAPKGKIAILMGDYTDREEGFVPLVFYTKKICFNAGLRQCTTDIIRFSHGASSGKKVYRSKFIPGLHDVCAIVEKRG